MELPQEIEVWYVIPTVRKELAKCLLDLGLTQKAIAAKLQVTEPAVSQYLKGKRGKDVKFTPSVLKVIQASAKKIKSSNLKGVTNKEIYKITNYVRKNCLCKIHKGIDKDRKSCGVCKK